MPGAFGSVIVRTVDHALVFVRCSRKILDRRLELARPGTGEHQCVRHAQLLVEDRQGTVHQFGIRTKGGDQLSAAQPAHISDGRGEA